MAETTRTKREIREENGKLFAAENGCARCLRVQTLKRGTDEPERDAFFASLKNCGVDAVLLQEGNALPTRERLQQLQNAGLYALWRMSDDPAKGADAAALQEAYPCFLPLPAAKEPPAAGKPRRRRREAEQPEGIAFRKARLDPGNEGCIVLSPGQTQEETLLRLQSLCAVLRPLTAFALCAGREVRLFVVNDSDTPFRGVLQYHPEGFDGTKGAIVRDAVQVGAHAKTQVVFFDTRELDARKQMLHLQLLDEAGDCVAFAHEVFAPPQKLRLCDPGLEVSPVLKAGQVYVTVRAQRFAYDVTLRCGDMMFSENRFSLCAGEERTVELPGAQTDFYEKLSVTSAYERNRRK